LAQVLNHLCPTSILPVTKMPVTMVIQDGLARISLAGKDMCFEPEPSKAAFKPAEEFEDGDETTDAGPGSASETESSSGTSCTEGSKLGSRGLGKRCRFGTTPLETIPATPVGTPGIASLSSPPGLSHAELRQARDACKTDALPVLTATEDITASSSSRPCRFGSTPLGTVPATPPQVAKFKALAKDVASPPGLSRAAMRQARDVCKFDSLPRPSWGASADPSVTSTTLATSPCAVPVTPPAVRSAKKRAAREALLQSFKKGAAMLKAEPQIQSIDDSADVEKCMLSTVAPKAALIVTGDLADSEGPADPGQDSSSEESSSESSAADGQRCRFGRNSFQTVPATPVGATAPMSLGSPPGLSRAAMRQARDSCKAGALSTTTWEETPPALRSAKRQAARDELLARAQQAGPATWGAQTSRAMLSTVPR